MDFAKRFGTAVAVMAMLAICRPASADTLLFTFTAGDLETIFNNAPNFGGGLCETNSQVAAAGCGVYQLVLNPVLTGGDTAVASGASSTIPGGGAAWSSGVSGAEAFFYVTPGDTSVAFLTENGPPGPQGNTFDINSGTLPATTPILLSDQFTFTLTTSGPNNAKDTIYNMPFNITVLADGISSNGTEASKGVDYTLDNAFLAPEPSAVWLCLIGFVLLGLGKNWRSVLAFWNRSV